MTVTAEPVYLKQAPWHAPAAAAEVRARVSGLLLEIERGGEAPVRRLSAELDGWSPPSFVLGAAEIRAASAAVDHQLAEHIAFAQDQVRGFARAQRATLAPLELEPLPGVTLGHRHLPVRAVGAYVPGGRYPMLASSFMTVAVAKVASMNELVSGRLVEPRIYTTILVAFATLALVLAAVGLYGVISYSVTQRTRELGVRLALGSSPGALTRSVLRQGARLTLIGVVIGLAGSWFATQSVTRMLPIVRPSDPVTLAVVAGLMLVVGSLAAYLPARRAARVDPLVALRSE